MLKSYAKTNVTMSHIAPS